MGFTEIASLDADIVIAIGKRDKKTGKLFPTSAEGYYLGNRGVNAESKRGESKLHFLQTPKGNLGVWGTTDLNRKLASVTPGVMVRITSTGTKDTPNGIMYTYKVEQDKTNTIEVENLPVGVQQEYEGSAEEQSYVDEENEQDAEADVEFAQSQALAALERKAKVNELLKSKAKK